MLNAAHAVPAGAINVTSDLQGSGVEGAKGEGQGFCGMERVAIVSLMM